jgi:hypothetical protein
MASGPGTPEHVAPPCSISSRYIERKCKPSVPLEKTCQSSARVPSGSMQHADIQGGIDAALRDGAKGIRGHPPADRPISWSYQEACAATLGRGGSGRLAIVAGVLALAPPHGWWMTVRTTRARRSTVGNGPVTARYECAPQSPLRQVKPPEAQGDPFCERSGRHRWSRQCRHTKQGVCLLHRTASASGTATLSSPVAARPTAIRRDVREPMRRIRVSKRSASKAGPPSRLRAAVEARRQDGAESPTSIVVLMTSIQPTRDSAGQRAPFDALLELTTCATGALSPGCPS